MSSEDYECGYQAGTKRTLEVLANYAAGILDAGLKLNDMGDSVNAMRCAQVGAGLTALVAELCENGVPRE